MTQVFKQRVNNRPLWLDFNNWLFQFYNTSFESYIMFMIILNIHAKNYTRIKVSWRQFKSFKIRTSRYFSNLLILSFTSIRPRRVRNVSACDTRTSSTRAAMFLKISKLHASMRAARARADKPACCDCTCVAEHYFSPIFRLFKLSSITYTCILNWYFNICLNLSKNLEHLTWPQT